jgi:hypothetical protein
VVVRPPVEVVEPPPRIVVEGPPVVHRPKPIERPVVTRPAPGVEHPIVVHQSPPAVTTPGATVSVVFTSQERDVIYTYVHSCSAPDKHGKHGKGLPPGLAKKEARGRELPPGWQHKCVRGAVIPQEVYRHCEPLPQEVVVKLPPPPPNTIVVAVDGRVLRLAKATLEILDVFDVL